MTRRSTILLPGGHDGTSQRARALPTLDPGYVRIDERDTADLLAFVQALARELRYVDVDQGSGQLRDGGSWDAFASHPDISIADMVAYLGEPDGFTGEKARWLGRPHFALLLVFLELLGHAREQQNGLTARHLDYYYKDVLQMQPEPARPDRASVLFRLAPGVTQLRLPAGTALEAGRDSGGEARIYRTERELVVNRAEVTELRSVFVDRRITGIPQVRDDRSLTAAGAFEGSLRLALGQPSPGDGVPPWRGIEIDHAFLKGLRGPIDVCRPSQGLHLEHHELRGLMRLVRRRDAGREWAEINALLGTPSPADPRDFAANLAAAVAPAVLDFKADGLPRVDDVDDLYHHRGDGPVRAYIDAKLAGIGYEGFTRLMQLKLRIDAEWAEINRVIQRAGQRKHGSAQWRFPTEGFDPTAFTANLSAALASELPQWPWQGKSIYDYEAAIRGLELHFALPIERLDRLVAFAEGLVGDKAEAYDWGEVDQILAQAHREQVYAARRRELAEVRGAEDSPAAFDRVASFVASQPRPPPEQPLPWDESRQFLAEAGHLDNLRMGLLDSFRSQLPRPDAGGLLGWADVDRILELAWRYIARLPEPVSRMVAWHNLYAWTDARACLGGAAGTTRWKTFGGPPRADAHHPPEPLIGWALRSPLLALQQGTRTLTLTLGFSPDGFHRDAFLHKLGLSAAELTPERLRQALAGAWLVQIDTAKGWIELAIGAAELAAGTAGDDYWSLDDLTRAGDGDRPALQLKMSVDPSCDPFAPTAGGAQSWPTLRMLLRERWDEKLAQWRTLAEPFEPLLLAGVRLRVDVAGLTDLKLQQEDRPLDPHKPFEPFGSQATAGARFYVSHPELVRERLDSLSFDITWMAPPADLTAHYAKYPDIGGAAGFTADIALMDSNFPLDLYRDVGLFETDTGATRSIRIDDVPGQLQGSSPGYAYTRRLDLPDAEDLRGAGRYLRFELGSDFGHVSYPVLTSLWAAELAAALANKAIDDTNPVSGYQVEPPYTPTIKELSARYKATVEIDPATPSGVDQLLHVQPFGETGISPDAPTLLPRYDQAGSLYIGLSGLAPPEHLSLLIQLAEGTSDPELEPVPVSWSCLDGDRWRDLDLLSDSTRGLLNSGIVELALPEAASGTGLPADQYWLRLAIPRDPDSLCQCVDIQAQAAGVRFEDRANAADHYQQPLPVGSISRLVESDARISAIEQPYTSFGGKPPERPERFRTRVSERLRHKQRALAPWDYERLVLQHFPGIYKAKCLPAGDRPGQVQMIVIPDIRAALPRDTFAPRAPADQLADIQTYLRERAPAAAVVEVRNPRYVPVRVRLAVRFRPGQDEGFARRRLNQDLVRFLSPWAFEEGAELTIGGGIYGNSILDFVDRRDYVDYVADVRLFRGAGKGDFEPIPAAEDYRIATERPDEVLVSARRHDIDLIPELGYEQASFTGIDYMKIELDFIVQD